MKDLLCVSAHLFPTTGFGGPSVSFSNFIDALELKKIPHEVISTCPGESYQETTDYGRKFFFKSQFLLKYGVSLGILYYLLKEQARFHTVIINGLTNFPLLLSAFIALLLGQEVFVFTRGGLEVNRLNHWSMVKKSIYRLNFQILTLVNRNNKLTLVYQSDDEKLRSELKATKELVCANYEADFFKSVDKNFATLNILYTGRLSPEKGSQRLLEFLDFFTKNASSKSTFTLAIAASESQVEELERFREHRSINLLYNVNKKEIKDLLERHNVVYMPSIFENFGNSLVEGIANGLVPCVYRDTHWSILLDKEAGLNESELRSLLVDLNIDQRYMRELSKKARQITIDKFIVGRDFSVVIDAI
jgi:glycosyltransferase involved in cell wall biosynthesis